MSILWITLAVLVGAFIVGGTAIYFLRARFIENLQADPSNIASVAAPVTVAEEVRTIGDQIEKAMAEQRLQGETQRQLLAQKLDTVRHTLDDQKQQVGGLRNELRHEIQRRDAEMGEIRQKISTIQSTIALPPASEPQAALPPASVPEPADAAPREPDVEDITFPIEAPPSPAASEPDPAPEAPAVPVAAIEVPSTPEAATFPEAAIKEAPLPPEAESRTFEETTFEEATPAAPAEPLAEAPTPDHVSFEVMSADAFASFEPAPEPRPAPEADAAPIPSESAEPISIDTMSLDEFASEASSFEEGASEADTFETISFEPPALPSIEPAIEAEPTFEPVSFAPPPVLEGDSFADISFDDVDFAPATAAPEPAPQPGSADAETAAPPPSPTPVFETWEPEDDEGAPAPFSTSDLLSMPSDSASETATEAPVTAPPPAAPQAAPVTSWVARPHRLEAEEAAEALGVPQPVVAPMDDFLPSPNARPASAPAPEAPAPVEPAPVPEAVVVEPTIIEPLGEEPMASSESETEAPSIPEGADDLTVISSIDEATQQLLYAEGVMTLDEIARWGRGEARRIGVAIQVSEETIMNQWVFEAQAALFDQFTRQG